MESVVQDLRYSVRLLWKRPGVTAAAIVSLALGIGANTTIYSLVRSVLLRPLGIEDQERVVSVFTTDSKNRGGFNEFNQTSYPNFKDYRERATAFEGLAAYAGIGANLAGGGEPERIAAEIVTGNYFDLLGVRPQVGRFFLPEEDGAPGAHPAVVLSDGLWRRRYAADPGILARTIKLDGRDVPVVGVAPRRFRGINAFNAPELWVPMAMHGEVLDGFLADNFEDRRALLFDIVGRLRPGHGVARASEELDRIGRALETEYPVPNRFRTATALPASETAINPNVRGLFLMAGTLLMTVVVLVLLIACANVANLLLARSSERRREIAVRLSMGAGRGRLVRQLLTESLVLSLLGGALGLLLAYWTRDLLLVWKPPAFLAPVLSIAIDGRVLGFTLLVSIATGLVFGLAPALHASRADLALDLKERTASSTRRRVTLRGALVVGQVALSLLSLVGAGLFLRSLSAMQRIEPGFDVARLMIVGVNPGSQGYDRPRTEDFYRRAGEGALAVPGVRGACWSLSLPIGGGAPGRTVFPEGRDESNPSTGTFVSANSVSPEYFETLGVPLLRGRLLQETDREGSVPVVVMNEAMAKRFWPGEDPIGKRFKYFGDTAYREVVGLVRNTTLFNLGEDPAPIAYAPLRQMFEPRAFLLARTEGPAAPRLEDLRRAVRSLDPDLPLTNVETAGQLVSDSLWAPRMGALLLSVFGALALVLSAVGLYGVMSYAVHQRTQEFGIRMALGAARRDVLRLVLRQGVWLGSLGTGLGLVGALALTRFVGALLVGVTATDPLTFAAIAALLLAVTLLAGYLPARRATRVDPTIALRYE